MQIIVRQNIRQHARLPDVVQTYHSFYALFHFMLINFDSVGLDVIIIIIIIIVIIIHC